MNTQKPRLGRQTGYMLLEGLISIVIFSVGVLGVVGMQAASIKDNSAAKYRTDASFLANELIGRMWASDRTPDTLRTNFGSDPAGAEYTAWLGDSSDPASGTVLGTLPGASANPPSVTVIPIAGSSPPDTSKSLVTVTVQWQLPGEAVHSYVAITEIK
jgi:type IV pilus assembly protein PilV